MYNERLCLSLGYYSSRSKNLKASQLIVHRKEKAMLKLTDAVSKSALAEHTAYLCSVSRPAIAIKRTQEAELCGTSRLGGYPDLPDGVEWPSFELSESNAKINGSKTMPYCFLAQINFAELPRITFENRQLLPTTGLLSLFVQYDFNGELDLFWGSENYIKAIFTAVPNALKKQINEEIESAPSLSIKFEEFIDLPYDQYQRTDWSFDIKNFREEYSDLRQSLQVSPDYLLGYPSHCSLAYDPTPGDDWISLLTLDSDDDWCWHDGDKLMIFIEKNALLAKDFSKLRSDAG